MGIETVDDLRDHLQTAIAIELSTVPAYLYAMYSLTEPSGIPAKLIRSILAEEMLHAALVTNLLLAVGGQPDYLSTRYMPAYPGFLPHHRPPLELHLAPASLELVRDVLMVIEQPEAPNAAPEEDDYETLGQFYWAIERSLHRLDADNDLFADVQLDRQMADESFYRPVQFDADDSGNLAPITDLESACAAIEVIIHQGEGLTDERWADPAHKELTHYHKLKLIGDGILPLGEVLPMPTNPRTAGYDESLQPVSDLFNAAYRCTYLVLHDIFQPGADKADHVGRLYQMMVGVMGPMARHLTQQPLAAGGVAGPTFEVHEFGDDPWSEVVALADRVADDDPALAPATASLRSCRVSQD